MPKRFSTKNLLVLEPPTPNHDGVGLFEFTDDYSIFHYGKMPDQIPGKGEAVCRIAAANFRMFAEYGIATHFLEFIPPNKMKFRLLRILDPQLHQLSSDDRNYFVPLQVIYRNTLPPYASIYYRVRAGTVSLQQLGLKQLPQPFEKLEPTLIEFTTKLEEIDRFITDEQAQQITCLSVAQIDDIRQFARRVNELIVEEARSVGMECADGKLEVGLDNKRQLMLVDVAGTPDENRFFYRGVDVSKQVFRNLYKATGLEQRIQEWVAIGKPRSEWPLPASLPAEMIGLISDMYKSFCEHWTGERVWNAPPLDEIVRQLRDIMGGASASANLRP